MLALYFLKLEKYVSFRPELWRPQLDAWKRMLDVGLPAGGEFALMFIYMGVVYWVISDFGAPAQAGFGIGSRIMQSIFMPAMAIAFAAGPIAGQNFGAGQSARVRETFAKAVMLNFATMGLVTLLLQWRPEVLIAFFTPEAEVRQVGADFLRIISWTFLAQGVVFTCSGIFQGLGNTRPALLSSAVRLATFVPLAVWLATRPEFELEQVWYVSVATVELQAAVSYSLLRGQFRRRVGDVAAVRLPGSATPNDTRARPFVAAAADFADATADGAAIGGGEAVAAMGAVAAPGVAAGAAAGARAIAETAAAAAAPAPPEVSPAERRSR
jgi:Na+-driven multidrug efflux pump